MVQSGLRICSSFGVNTYTWPGNRQEAGEMIKHLKAGWLGLKGPRMDRLSSTQLEKHPSKGGKYISKPVMRLHVKAVDDRGTPAGQLLKFFGAPRASSLGFFLFLFFCFSLVAHVNRSQVGGTLLVYS